MPSRNVCLYGTEEAAAAARRLTAGPVTVEFENGALRHIKYRGIEVLRGIAFLIRNVNWGTYTPDIADLQVKEVGGGFHVTYRARCSDDSQAFVYTATVTGTPEGALSFEVDGAPEGNFRDQPPRFYRAASAGWRGRGEADRYPHRRHKGRNDLSSSHRPEPAGFRHPCAGAPGVCGCYRHLHDGR